MSNVRTIAGGDSCNTSCHAPAPDIFDCCPCPSDPCLPAKCPPKTKAKDAIRVERNEVERCISLTGWTCQSTVIPLNFHCVGMQLRQKGLCKVLMTLTPVRVTYEGSACFRWDDCFRDLPEGYYEGDVYIDDVSCVTVLLYLPPCRQIATTEEVIYDDGPCAPPEQNSCCVGGVAQLDGEPVPDMGVDNCGECDA